MNISEKLTQIANKEAENIQLNTQLEDILYSKDMGGISPWGDKSKIIEKSASGEYISVDDVSEIPHQVDVRLTSGNGKNLWKRGDQTFTRASYTNPVELSAGKTYTFSALVTSSDTDNDDCLIYDATNVILLGYIKRDARSSITFTLDKDITTLSLYAGRNKALSEGDTATFKDIMIEEGDTATEYEPYKKTLTDYSGVSLTGKGSNWFDMSDITGMKNTAGTDLSSRMTIEDNIITNTYSFYNSASYYVLGTPIKLPIGTYNLSAKIKTSNCSTTNIGFIYSDNSNKRTQVDNTVYNEWVNVSYSITLTEEKNLIGVYMQGNRNNERECDFQCTDIQINIGSTALPYEPYNGKTVVANSDGTVEDVGYSSPYMYLTTDNKNVTINVDYRKSYGMQTEYDRFWDRYQDYGNKSAAEGMFAGKGWNDETFNPKYDLKVGTALNLFWCSSITDLVSLLKKLGRNIDWSNCYNISSCFSYSSITHIGEINLTQNKLTSMYNFCAQATKLHTIDKIKVYANLGWGTAFANCNALENITFEGTIGNTIAFPQSTKLSKSSILNIFSVLSSTVEGQTLTLSTAAVTNAFGSTDSTEWTNLVATKSNWTISLV